MARSRKRINLARALRQRDVPAEVLLWKALRNRALGGFKFRRQHPIGGYIVDFACVECKVIVELDGKSHLHAQVADRMRARTIEAEGWLMLRFWNTEVYEDFEPVREAIYAECVRRGKSR